MWWVVMCWAFSDLKASSVRKYFPRDGLSSLPPPTTTGFNASSMPGLQEVMGIIEAFPAIWISRTNNHSQICSASQDLPPEVKVGWLECFYRWNRTSWWAGLLFVSHYVKFWLFWQQHEEYKVIYAFDNISHITAELELQPIMLYSQILQHLAE